MKNSTAYKQAKSSIRFLAVVVPCLWALCFWTRSWGFAALATFDTLYLLMDIGIVRKINRESKNDPDYFKRKIPGT